MFVYSGFLKSFFEHALKSNIFYNYNYNFYKILNQKSRMQDFLSVCIFYGIFTAVANTWYLNLFENFQTSDNLVVKSIGNSYENQE